MRIAAPVFLVQLTQYTLEQGVITITYSIGQVNYTPEYLTLQPFMPIQT